MPRETDAIGFGSASLEMATWQETHRYIGAFDQICPPADTWYTNTTLNNTAWGACRRTGSYALASRRAGASTAVAAGGREGGNGGVYSSVDTTLLILPC